MGKFIVIEMQNGVIGANSWSYEDKADAEVKFYQTVAVAVKSPVEKHTVMLVTAEGYELDYKCYEHGTATEPEPNAE